MTIKTPNDLFAIHQLNEELQLKITEFYNADKGILLEINALLLAIERGCVEGKELYTHSCFLVRQRKVCVVYKKEKNSIEFIDIKRQYTKRTTLEKEP